MAIEKRRIAGLGGRVDVVTAPDAKRRKVSTLWADCGSTSLTPEFLREVAVHQLASGLLHYQAYRDAAEAPKNEVIRAVYVAEYYIEEAERLISQLGMTK